MRIYTSGEVSKLCEVATTTVNRWFDSGQLKGFRVPGSKHRRIPRANLIEFLKGHGFPLERLADDDLRTVLLVSGDRSLGENLKGELSNLKNVELAVASSTFDAGIAVESGHADCVVVDFELGRLVAEDVCRMVRRRAGVLVIGLLPAEGPPVTTPDAMNDVFRKPFDPALLAACIRRHFS